MLSDEDIAKIRRYADRYHEVPACFVADTLDEITRLRAEVARLEAGRLRPETVRALRKTLLNCGDWNAGAESLADLGRCYPPEEV